MNSKLNGEVEARVDALLARLSVDQKLGQMIQAERKSITPEDIRDFGLGSVLSGAGSCPGENGAADWIAMNDAFWAASVAEGEGRVPIPILYGVDAVHGHANVRGATVFPHNIGLGAADDPDLLGRVAQTTAREVLATGVEWTFAPTLAVARNERWGRTYESYGEDPAIVAKYAGAFVRGLQAECGPDGVVACAKHWVGDGGTEGGRDQGDTRISAEEMERLHIAPYLPALEAGVLTVMASYNSWNGTKCHGNQYLLTDVLKGRLGFDGFVVSDWDGTDQLADQYEDAIVLAVNAGVDMLMVSVQWRRCLEALRRGVADGTIPMARVDDAVRRILRVKVRYGLFERPRPAERPWSRPGILGAAEHRAIAREAVRKSLVLLQDRGGLLPLDRSAGILVAGKNADDIGHQCGGFTIAWQGTSGNSEVAGGTSIWGGIKAQAPQAELSVDGSAADPARHRVAIVVIGERPYAEGAGDLCRVGPIRAGSGGGRLLTADLVPYGQSLELATLHPEDLAVLQTIAARGIPIVAVLVSGRALVINRELEVADAFVAAWLPGSEGQGVADVLFGDHDFQGRLPCSWPVDAADAPNVGDAPYRVRFPLGHGLRFRSPS